MTLLRLPLSEFRVMVRYYNQYRKRIEDPDDEESDANIVE